MTVIGQAEQDFAIYQDYQVTGDSEMGKEEFLTLLVAQLSNQDPLNPMEDKEFTAQLAEFSSLEQLTNISDGIDSLVSADTSNQMLTAVSFIGKQVLAQGDTLSLINGEASSVYMELESNVAGGLVNVFDANGNLLYTQEFGARTAGTYEFVWNGLDYNDQQAPDGMYYVAVGAVGENGESVMVYTDVAGTVSGVQTEDGVNYLRLSDGRIVDFMNIKEVINPSTGPSQDTDITEEQDSETEEESSEESA